MELRERIAGERRRLRKVREALSAAVTQTSRGDEAYIPFYLAIAAYFEAAMERLHTQDVRMGDLLREKADMDNPENQQVLGELDRRLKGNQVHLKKFLAGGKLCNRKASKDWMNMKPRQRHIPITLFRTWAITMAAPIWHGRRFRKKTGAIWQISAKKIWPTKKSCSKACFPRYRPTLS